LNALGILIGGVMGMMMSRQFSAPTQLALRGMMGVLTIFIGLRLTWTTLANDTNHIPRQLLAVILSLMLGRLAGRLLRIQKNLNRLGQYASKRFAAARPDDPNRFNEGFVICALLFCAGPLGPIGAVQDGLMGYWEPLGIKMVMDGLAAMGFVSVFGWGVMLSALPVFVYQGTIALAVHNLEPFLTQHQLLDSVNAVGGLLVFCVALVVLELKKFELGDYLPSLVTAPLVTWLLRQWVG
jgi:uncharacterized membrane protein YqgA involved in biofilm formation